MYLCSYMFWLAAILQLHGTDCTDCYSCTDVNYVASCNTVVKCQPGQICYTDIHASKYTLGCRESAPCSISNSTLVNSGGAGSIVGRSATPSDCSQCCETAMCNRQLCQPNGLECHDSGHIDCATTGQFVEMCGNTDHSKQECRRFCGLCSMVDGGWSVWSTWSTCSTSCGNGTSTRSRSCSNPAPVDGGANCAGNNHEAAICSNDKCPVNGGWSPWSSWGSCSVSCGIGMQRRDRSCSHPYPSVSGFHCFGDARDDRVCLPGACNDGGWSVWGSWSTCSETCGVCTQTRSRSCTSPAPSKLGRYCTGNNLEVKANLIKPCVDQNIGFTVHTPKDTGTSGHITFTNVVTNSGGGYNTATGVFTCKVAGAYVFSLTLIMQRGNDHSQCLIYKNSQFLGGAHVHPDTTSLGYFPASVTVYVHLLPGDKVFLGYCTPASTMSQSNLSSFSGFLVHMD